MNLYYPISKKPEKKIATGSLSLVADNRFAQQKVAYFIEKNQQNNDRVVAELKHPEIVFITSDGIRLKGYESNGVDPTGREKMIYQEWYVSFKEQ